MCRCLRIIESCCQHFLNTLQPFDTEDENKISNYLYDRSREIEPKNCKKPPSKDRKWPNNYLKSPGIKVNRKTMPNPLLPPRPHPCPNEGLPQTKAMEGDEMSVSGVGISSERGGGGSERGTPTPTSPVITPFPLPPSQQKQEQQQQDQQQQQHGQNSDQAIFGLVEIGGPWNTGSIPAEPRNSISFPSSSSSSSQVPPPPLPPRRKREPSIGDTSPKVKQAPDAPELPPRDVSPPPIPPRISTNTLPRVYSSGGSHFHHAHPPPPAHSLTLHHPHHHPHHRPAPPSFLVAPSHPPPQHYLPQDSPLHRRNNSVDLTSPTPLTRRHTNGPHSVLPASVVSDGVAGGGGEPVDHPPTPPPRLSCRHAFTFTYDQHHS